MQTRLLYLQDMCTLSCQAHVVSVIQDAGECRLVLDQTVFYPQGGGQPADRGIIKNQEAIFSVQNVSNENGTIYHKGIFQTGSFKPSTVVEVDVDPQVRVLHNKNHTAGHLIDYSLAQLGYSLISGKAYHYPQGPYVEYNGTLEQSERAELQLSLEKVVNELVQQHLPVIITILENNPNKRAMFVRGYAPILCGGTHVINTKDIGYITIRKIKNEKGNLRVSYAVI